MPTDPTDRSVHAECENFEVVRYDRSGKWYVEPKGDIPRSRINVTDAAHRALAAETLGGTIHTGALGGRIFDGCVTKLRMRHNL